MKKAVAIILCLFSVFAFTACAKVKLTRPFELSFYDDNVNNYEQKRAKVEYASEHLPALESLGEYTDASYTYKHRSVLLFESEAIALFVKYGEDYEAKKAEALSSRELLAETVISEDGEYYLSAPAAFSYGGYDFRTVMPSEELGIGGTPCKAFMMIGSNDTERSIAYCYFYDFDLDYIAETSVDEQEAISDFIDNYFVFAN